MKIEPRTWRGLFWAALSACAVLVFIHIGRPFLADHGVRIHYDEDVTCWWKGALAISALALSLQVGIRRLMKRPPYSRRLVGWVSGVLAFVSVLSFFASDEMQPGKYHHDWEHFHYYFGAKYTKELGYKRIYLCAAIAQAELGPQMEAEVRDRKIRDLETNLLERAAPALDDPEKCKSHFSEERWEAFRTDIGWFRSHTDRKYWNSMNTDHGYNAPPVWTMTGHILSSVSPLNEASLTRLASIDLLLFVGMFFAIWWAFGGRVLALSLIFFGAQFPANGVFTGGAFLRQDWLFLLVLAACLTRKRYYALAGGALAWSALLRVFPVIFMAGWVVVGIAYFVRHRRFAPAHKRLALGVFVACAVLVPASVAIVGKDAYPGFVAHIGLHNGTPLTNNMGLPQMMAYSESGRAKNTRNAALPDEFEEWARQFKEHSKERKPFFWGLVLAIGALFVVVVRRVKNLWIAQALGLVLVSSVATLTCYYYSFFLLAPLLSKAIPRIERGTLLLAAASAWFVLWPRISYNWDDRYYYQSAIYVAFAIFLLLAFARSRSAKRKSAPAPLTPAAATAQSDSPPDP